ncbi:translation initiation factor IF-2-like [Lemur catta]|uniref:translation initiation factor IF-2-like n=1 Tax=Lemur catta TaxID=9447 RepID=UPI001E26A1FE|nr:translation initiation factor IF-2-like [Lemur catta]
MRGDKVHYFSAMSSQYSLTECGLPSAVPLREVGKPSRSPGTRLTREGTTAGPAREPAPQLRAPRLGARPPAGSQRAPRVRPNHIPPPSRSPPSGPGRGWVPGARTDQPRRPPGQRGPSKTTGPGSQSVSRPEDEPRDKGCGQRTPPPAGASAAPAAHAGTRSWAGGLGMGRGCARVGERTRKGRISKNKTGPRPGARKREAAAPRRVTSRSSQVCSATDKLSDPSFSWLQPGFPVTGWRREIQTSELLPEEIKCASPAECWGGWTELE